MRYHFLAYRNDDIPDRYDYYASIDYVLDIFLKQTLKDVVKQNELSTFICDYVSDLSLFFNSLRDLLKKVDNE